MENIHGLALVIAQRERTARQGDFAMLKCEGSAREIARTVFDREPDAREGLFEMPPVHGRNPDAVRVEPFFQIGLDEFVAANFDDDQRVFRRQDERAIFPVEMHLAIPAHGLADFDAHILRNLVLAVGLEGGDDFLGGDACRGRIPQREGVDPVRVHVLRAFLQLGKPHEPVARRFVVGRIDLHEHGEIALDDEGIFWFVVHDRSGACDWSNEDLSPRPPFLRGKGEQGFLKVCIHSCFDGFE